MTMTNLVEEIAVLFANSDVAYVVEDKGFETVFFYDYCEAVGGHLKNITVMGACISITYNHMDIADVKREIADVKGRE